jgi:CRP-like cAMP-binding protein
MNDYLHTVLASPLFSGCTEDEAAEMLRCLAAVRARFGRGEFILRAGDRTESLGLLLSGSALVIQEDYWGNRNILAKLQPGDVFAEAFACSPGARLTVSVAAEADCRVLWLGVQRILTTCAAACPHHSRLIRSLLAVIAEKNLQFNEKLTHMGQRTTREKVLSYLSVQALRNNAREFDIPFNRQQLADYLSVDRSALSASLSGLRKAGVLTFRKNHFHLTEGH